MAHRTTGDSSCNRLAILSKEPLEPVSEDLETGKRHFQVETQGAIDSLGNPPLLNASYEASGHEAEATWLWDDEISSPIWYRRRKGELSQGTTGGREPVMRGIFNYFKGLTGKDAGVGPGPFSFENPHIRTRTYNIEGPQWGFHRGHGSDELWMQFRSTSLNYTEQGDVHLAAGESTIAFPGDSHRINGYSGFLRLNLYSQRPLKLCVDPSQMVTNTNFIVSEVEG